MKKLWLALVWLSSLLILQWCGATDGKSADIAWTKVLIETDLGNMTAVLYDSTPLHKENFIKLANEGYYNDLLFHRVIAGFMIQGGDPESRDAAPGVSLWRWWPDYKIDAEIGQPHFKGTLAAARQWWAINPEKKSSGSQFYIVQWTPQTQQGLETSAAQKWISYTQEQIDRYVEVWGTSMLDGDYTVFGEIIEWLDIVDVIAAVETAPWDRPLDDVKMKVSVIE